MSLEGSITLASDMMKNLTKDTPQPVILRLYVVCSFLKNLLHHFHIVHGSGQERERERQDKGIDRQTDSPYVRGGWAETQMIREPDTDGWMDGQPERQTDTQSIGRTGSL